MKNAFSHGSFRGPRTPCGTTLWLAIVAIALLASVSQSLAEERCIPRVGYFSPQPGQQFVGLYRIALDPPDFHDPISVQRHLIYSTTWAHLVSNKLPKETRDQCGVRITPYAFPDLRAFLFVRRSTGHVDRDKSACAPALQEILLRSQPNYEAVKQAATWAALFMQPAQPSGRSGAEILDEANILQATLPQIYERNTLLHALTSVDSTTYESLDVVSFRSWLLSQQSDERSKLVSISHCLPPTYEPAGETARKTLGRSRVVPPGGIRIVRGVAGSVPPGPLRYLVIVGNPARPSSPLSPSEITAKYCDREHSFSVEGPSSSVVTVMARIRCKTTSIYDLDSWTVLYCEPSDCASGRTDEAVMATISNDPDILAHARRSAYDAIPRGPYLVTIVAR
jgi:hypothetical protein